MQNKELLVYRKSVSKCTSGRMYSEGRTVIHWLNFLYTDKWEKANHTFKFFKGCILQI